MNYMSNKAIEQYILGQLSTKDQAGFEQAMKTHPQLKKEVAIQKEILDMVESMGDVAMFQRIQEITKATRQQQSVPSSAKTKKLPTRRRFLYLSAAAAAILLVVMGYFAFFQAPQQQVIASYMDNMLTIEVTRNASTTSAFQETLQQGKQNYLKKDYRTALSTFETIMEDNATARLGAARCYFQLGQYEKAIAQFDVLGKDKAYAYPQLVKIYQALTYIHIKEIEKAKQLLEPIAKGNHPYAKDAQKILTALAQ